MIKKLLIGSAVLLTLVACSDDKAQNFKEVPTKGAKELPVEVVTIKERHIPIWLPYTGKTQASSSQEVRARVAGILEEIYFKDGENVKKGQKLFKIEQTDYIASLNDAKAKKKKKTEEHTSELQARCQLVCHLLL